MLALKQVQKNLKYYMAYYTGAVDGLSGPKTEAAVKAFQKEYGLAADGICGVKTESKLISVVKKCQKAVGTETDGIIGANTIAAVKRFQKKKGLTADGIIGVKTLTKINQQTFRQSIDWSKVKYFKKTEFRCDCGGKYCDGYPAEIDPVLVQLLEKTRRHYGKPVQITSGLRCRARNNQLSGSSPASKHMDGKAADIWIVGTEADNDALVKWFRSQSCTGYSYTGFGAVHVEVK